MNRTLRLALLLLMASIFLFSAWKLFGILRSYREGSDTYDALSQYAAFETTPPVRATVPSAPTDPIPSTAPAPDVSRWPQVDFEALSAINPDVIGWIYMDGTNIHYPIVQGQDNDYYLNHLFDGTRNRSGSIFMDYRCASDFSDRHTIIYGHHLRDRTMFTNLMQYKKQAFYDEHSVILLVTPTAYYQVRVFSGYVSSTRANAWDLDLDDAGHAAWLEEIREKSCFQTAYAPGPEDAIITLSTCTYEFENAKFVLHGYIEEIIEKE